MSHVALPATTGSSNVFCDAWQDMSLGSGTGSSAYAACMPDTVVLTTNAVTPPMATSDNHEMVYHELCGNGSLTVKIPSLSGGAAGLFVRESSAAGSRKCAVMTQKSAQVFRQLRASTGMFQQQAAVNASGHEWLRIVRSGSNVVTYWSTNGSTWNLAFTTPFATADNCVLLGMYAYSNNSNTNVQAVFTNVTVTQSDATPATSIAFADSLIQAQSGDSILICATLQNPCVCSPVSVDIVLASDSLPHFEGYEPVTLTFSGSDTLQCFYLVAAASDTSGVYSFELSGIQGGNNTEIEGPATLTIEIEGVGEELPPGLCGAFVKALPEIDSTKTYYADRFGNLYEQEELLLPENLNSGCGCAEFTDEDITGLSASYFNLVFEDCVYNYNAGFNQQLGDLGIARRKVACRVFANLSQLIIQRASPCQGDDFSKVNIRFLPYNDSQVVSWQNGPVLAAASPVFESQNYSLEGGIIDCLPWKILNNGRYTSLSGNADIFHASIGVDFTKSFYTEVAPPDASDDNLFDLYDVLLHEALHAVGFFSLLNPSTGGYFSTSFTSYNRYDTFLKLQNGAKVVVQDANDPYVWNLNINEGDLHTSCVDNSTENMVFPPLAGDALPIYNEMDNAAFSHLDARCPNAGADYLMKPSFDRGVRVDIGEAELKILCALGYEVIQMENCSCVAAGDHDLRHGCDGEPLVLELCEDVLNMTINLSALLENDQPSQGIGNLVNINPNIGTLEVVGGSILYTPCAPGVHRFKYTPIAEDCQDGSTAFIEILVRRCFEDCSFFLSDNPINGGHNNNTCNLICNPEIVIHGTTGGNVLELESANFGACYDLPGWFGATGTINYYSNPTAFPGSGNIHMIHGGFGSRIESAFTPANVTQGNYFFSFYATARHSSSAMLTGNMVMNAMLVDADITALFGRGANFPSRPSQVDLNQGNYSLLTSHTFPFFGSNANLNSGSFSRAALCVELAESYFSLWLYPEEGDQRLDVFLDEVELIPDDFSAGEDFVSIGCDFLGGPFCMLSDVPVRYQWFEVTGGNETLIAEYTVLNGVATVVNGDVDHQTQQLFIEPEQTTTYRVRRSLTTPHNLPSSFEFCTLEDDVTVTVLPSPPVPEFGVLSESCGLVTFFLNNLHPGDSYLINYGDGTSGTELIHNYGNATNTYQANVVISNSCGETNLNAIAETVYCPPFSCETCEESLIGEDGQTLKLSVAIGNDLLPADGTDIQVCVKGTLLIDQNYNIVNSIFYMLPGSRIEIQDGSALAVINSDFSGCDNMWYAIEVQLGGGMKMIGSRVADAQYAVYLHSYSGNDLMTGGVSIYDNDFDNNFVGLLAGGASPGRVNAGVGNNRYTQTAANLLPPFAGQSSAPEGLPEQNQHALAGIVADNLSDFNSLNNRFEQLTSGIVARHSNLGSYMDQQISIRSNNAAYPAWDYRGRGVSIQSTGIHSAKVEKGYFEDCPQGIMANNAKLKATENEMLQMEVGIWAAIGSAGGISITNNEIEATRLGIVFAHPDPNGGAVITNNIVNTDTENAIAGIWQLFSSAPALLGNNTVTVGKAGMGIGSAAAAKSTLRDNTVSLSDPTAAAAGIDLANVTKSLLKDNIVTGGGTGGPDNIALRIVSSAGNVYCCNTLSNTRIGAHISGGSLATDNFRGTSFSNHATSLLLPDVNAILGTQTHTKNCWGANAGAAVYGVPSTVAEFFPFIVDNTQNTCFLPQSYSPTEWFIPTEDLVNQIICNEEVCSVDEFAPESDDVKRMALGDTSVSAAVMWDLQRYIYERLQGETVQNASVINFLEQAHTNTIGAFYSISKGIEALFAADTTTVALLKANLIYAEEKLDSIVLIDLALPAADSSAAVFLWTSRGELVNDLFILAEDNTALAQELADAYSSEAEKLRSQNDSIIVATDYEYNEKAVNDIYLSRLAELSFVPDSSEVALLESIAEQCPFTGGNAVYRARALLALLTKEAAVYNDSLACLPVQALVAPPNGTGSQAIPPSRELNIYPNPTRGEVDIVWNGAVEQSGRIAVFDLFGRQLQQIQVPVGSVGQNLSLRHLPEGLYVVRTWLDNQEFVNKLVIKH